MARPKKDTIDYFPHDCNHTKELKIIISQFGNEGYAFYYRLLELLGKSPSHKIACDGDLNWQYFLSETEVDDDTAKSIISTLLSIGIVDKKIWKSKEVIWVQSFVDSFADVYEKRKTELPTKDSFLSENIAKVEFAENKQGFCGENPDFRGGNSQSKVKESKLNKSKGEESMETAIFDSKTLYDLKKEYSNVDVEKSLKRYVYYRKDSGKTPDLGGFRLWLDDDIDKGINIKSVDIGMKLVEYMCPNDHGSVMASKDPYKFCEICEEQYLKQYEYDLINNKAIKIDKQMG